MNKSLTFHLVANAHLDPVWFWDWREGLNEGIITSRTILDLMDECEGLTCIRGEAAIYEHIERFDPQTFRRIRRHVREGRWDVVGGTYVQPDMNLPAAETLLRHFVRSKKYFRERFNREVTVAWAADAFGHSAGLPEILSAAGMTGFAFTRPSRDILPIPKPAFWWLGSGGARVLAYRPIVGNYGVESDDDMGKVLDKFLAAAPAGDLENVGVFYGLGNHGGGPTRKHFREIKQWAARHPEVKVLHSGLHRLFEALHAEVRRKGAGFLPAYRGELNFCMRGCYASVAKFKYAYRETENLLVRSERTAAAVSAALVKRPPDLGGAWDGLLFNTFHDILPGSSIERAYDDQLAWLGGIRHQCRVVELESLNALAARVNTAVSPSRGDHPSPTAFLAWNPHPRRYDGPLELEACMDYRPIPSYANRADELPVVVRGPEGKPLAIQKVATEHASYRALAWRKRVVFNAKLPPLGWCVYTLGWEENVHAPSPEQRAWSAAQGEIANNFYRVKVARGAGGIKVWHRGRPVFGAGGMRLATVADRWGSWGGASEEKESLELSAAMCRWRVTDAMLLENGPVRAALWVKMEGGRSRVEQIFSLCAGRDVLDVSARVYWNEEYRRLKVIMPVGDTADYEVPGGAVRRGLSGEVPGGRWVRVRGKGRTFVFASDALYAFNSRSGALMATICRSTRYAISRIWPDGKDKWRPPVDAGELKFRYAISCGRMDPGRLSDELEQPPVALMVPPHPGRLPRCGSLADLKPGLLRIMALKPAEDGRGIVLRAQNTGKKAVPAASLRWLGEKIALEGSVLPWQIKSWRLSRISGRWRSEPSGALETRV